MRLQSITAKGMIKMFKCLQRLEKAVQKNVEASKKAVEAARTRVFDHDMQQQMMQNPAMQRIHHKVS